jgi:hypothetical protein
VTPSSTSLASYVVDSVTFAGGVTAANIPVSAVATTILKVSPLLGVYPGASATASLPSTVAVPFADT